MSLSDATERDGATTLPVGGEGELGPSPYVEGDVVAGKYQLTKVLGEGGMGSVWLAHNQMLNVDVALKLIRSELASAHTAERLLREARATARLEHPSTVRVHDFGETERGDPFIVMEVLDGEALDVLLERRGALPPTRAVQLMLPIVSALAEAHEHGVVHRDIKPENIIVVTNRQGTVMPKVLDFGIAKVERAKVISGEIPNDSAGRGAHDLQRRLTKLGTLVGSPDYMSPEQGRGDMSVDERADIWAVCVVLYELIAGRRPFEGAEVQDVLISLMTEDPTPLSELGADATLWQIVGKGLEKRRDDRWRSARELGEALAGWLLDAGVETDVTGAALRTQWFADDPSTERTSMASLHLDPLSVSTQASVSVPTSPGPGDEDAGTRRALYAVVGATMLVLGMGIALVVIEPGQRDEEPAGGVAPVMAETTAAPAAEPVDEPSSETEVEAKSFEADPDDERDAVEDEAGPAASATATAVVKPVPRTKGPRPTPRPKTGSKGLPLPPDKPDF